MLLTARRRWAIGNPVFCVVRSFGMAVDRQVYLPAVNGNGCVNLLPEGLARLRTPVWTGPEGRFRAGRFPRWSWDGPPNEPAGTRMRAQFTSLRPATPLTDRLNRWNGTNKLPLTNFKSEILQEAAILFWKTGYARYRLDSRTFNSRKKKICRKRRQVLSLYGQLI